MAFVGGPECQHARRSVGRLRRGMQIIMTREERREIAAPLEIPSLNRSIKMCGWLKSRVRQCRHPRQASVPTGKSKVARHQVKFYTGGELEISSKLFS